jgi:hypothetical protein
MKAALGCHDPLLRPGRDLGPLQRALRPPWRRPRASSRTSTTRPGPTYHLMGFDTEMFTPLFIAARITGWTAHIMEQVESNSLIRPLSAYNGPEERPRPLSERPLRRPVSSVRPGGPNGGGSHTDAVCVQHDVGSKGLTGEHARQPVGGVLPHAVPGWSRHREPLRGDLVTGTGVPRRNGRP